MSAPIIPHVNDLPAYSSDNVEEVRQPIRVCHPDTREWIGVVPIPWVDGSCKVCAANTDKSGRLCNHLPPCSGVTWKELTPKTLVDYTIARLEGEFSDAPKL